MTTTFMSSPSLFLTSESVTEGHPDKMCDQISDAVLDAILKEDPYGRVACETACTTGLVVVIGEITTTTYVDIPSIVRETVRDIGYNSQHYGFDYETCGVIVSIGAVGDIGRRPCLDEQGTMTAPCTGARPIRLRLQRDADCTPRSLAHSAGTRPRPPAGAHVRQEASPRSRSVRNGSRRRGHRRDLDTARRRVSRETLGVDAEQVIARPARRPREGRPRALINPTAASSSAGRWATPA
jgi:hypothetical protein